MTTDFESKLFDNLTPIQETENIILFYDLTGKLKLKQDAIDKHELRVPFLAYIGGQTKEELEAIASILNPLGFEIRKPKRLVDYPFELKLQGVSWNALKSFVKMQEKAK